MMLISKCIVVVEMTVPSNGLAVFGIRHRHVTCHNLIVLLGNTYDSVFRIIITPCRNKHGVLVIV